jgi:hypothetical protein
VQELAPKADRGGLDAAVHELVDVGNKVAHFPVTSMVL